MIATRNSRARLAALVLAAATTAACGSSDATPGLPTSPTSPFSFAIEAGSEAVMVGAGDIAVCGSPGSAATAKLLDQMPGTIFTLGDNAYPNGTADDFRRCYEPTWGRHKGRTRPSPGNHDYDTPGANPYFNYFGSAAGPAGLGYYRYTLAGWQIYSLNSNIPMGAGSAQLQWLQGELNANPSRCSLAYWHHPRFSSGPHGDDVGSADVWRALYAAGADIALAGHDHLYERFAPQSPDGRSDFLHGMREFIVGTGGAELTPPVISHANSEARAVINGVLRLTLRSDGYTWVFVSEGGASLDSGVGTCVDA